MPVIYSRQSRTSGNDGLTPLRIGGIVLVIVLALFFVGLFLFRRRQLKKREAESSRRARRFIKVTFPRPAPDPDLPPYEPPRESQGQELQSLGSGSSAAGTSTPRSPPPARVHTPPGYGLYHRDRPVGPLSDSPPAYSESDRQTWGRSGCPR